MSEVLSGGGSVGEGSRRSTERCGPEAQGVALIRTDDCDGFGGAAVVVDVMRAFTVAAWTFALGAERIILVRELADAVRLKSEIPGALAFKDGPPDPAFDLFNSPAQLLDLDVTGRVVVQRTRDGTRGALAARHAEPLLCASFVCASATVEVLKRCEPTAVTFVITGDDGTAEEDLACAEFMAALLTDGVADPGPYVERARCSPAAIGMAEDVAMGRHGIDARDVDMCLDVDRFDFAMVAEPEGEHLVLRATRP